MVDPMGLRERKRLATMRRIQEAALDLFDEHGYGQVTIERIAERAEVSASTVYRYFGTKEQLVLSDEYDPMAFEFIARELRSAPFLEAVRLATMTVLQQQMGADREHTMRRLRYIFSEPTILAGMLAETEEMIQLAVELLAPQLGRSADDQEVQVAVSALIHAVMTTILAWYRAGPSAPIQPFLETTFRVLESGLHLEPTSPAPRAQRPPDQGPADR